MPLIPIGTDVQLRRAPMGNWLLICANVGIFALVNVMGADWVARWLGPLDAAVPSLAGYFTYQFRHGDMAHLAGNMLFLWIFGHAVCDRLGSVNYVTFYLAGGVFAGVVFAAQSDNQLVGASGAIAAVTTAFLVLYPRSHVTLLVWLFFITWFQLPAMLVIVFKVILWDNILAPSLDRNAMMSNVAYSAHLGGYAFGFVVTLAMLAVRAVPRNQFDLLAIWSRRRRRGSGGRGADERGGEAGRRGPRQVWAEEMDSRPIESLQLTPVERLREDIMDRLSEHDQAEALRLHGQLLEIDPQQVLPRPQQLEIANLLAQSQRHAAAVAAYEAFLRAYPGAQDAPQVQLLVGLILNRYLRAYARAAAHLRAAIEGLSLEAQRKLALQELQSAQRGLGETNTSADPTQHDG